MREKLISGTIITSLPEIAEIIVNDEQFNLLSNLVDICCTFQAFNDIYQETVVQQVGTGILTCYRVFDVLPRLTRLVLLASIVIFSLIFGPQVTKLGLRVSTNKKIKVKRYEAIILQKARFIGMQKFRCVN